MTTVLDLPHGAWWRFEAYEVRSGCIRPKEGARLERYDPWAEHRARLGSQGDRSTTGANRVYPGLAYSELLDCMQGVSIHITNKRSDWHFSDPAAEAAVLDWASRHGLLGILPHTCEAAMMPLQQGERRGDSRLPISRRYYRTPEGWWSQTVEAHIPDDWSSGEATLEDIAEWMTTPPGAVLPEWYIRSLEDQWPDFYQRGAMVREPPLHPGSGPAELVPLQPQHLARKPLSEVWTAYFPEAPLAQADRHVYPAPLTDEFWRLYAEPLDQFVNWCRILRQALTGLGDDRGRSLLHALVGPLTPSVLPTTTGLRQAWLSPSLLASLAMMALLDQTEGRLTHVCASCHKLFVSSAYQVQYCSQTCRFREQKRAQRAREREAVERHAQGATLKQIAKALGTEPDIVAGWISKSASKKRKDAR